MTVLGPKELTGLPFEGDVQPSSLDLKLGEEFAIPIHSMGEVVDVTDPETYPEYEFLSLDESGWAIAPGEFVLAHTEEVVDLPASVVGFLWGRSSVGRLGLFVHNAGLVDAGFTGDLTLELYNAASYPIKLKSGMRIAQMTVHDQSDQAEYGEKTDEKYQGQRGPTPSQLYEDFE